MSDIDSEYDELLWRDEATSRLLSLRDRFVSTRDVVSVDLPSLNNQVVAEAIHAPSDQPAHDIATMDGFAFSADDDYPLTLVDAEIFPEDSPPELASGETVRIATGAPLPDNADAVMKREDATVTDGRLEGESIEAGNYTYQKASNIAKGEQLFAAGDRLSPKDAILLRDLGLDVVDVFESFSVGILATGTEIHEGRTPDLDSAMLAGLILAWGHTPVLAGSVPDDYAQVKNRIESLADQYDIVMTTGGTSVGKKDYVIRALDDIGTVLFHSVRIRPGKPMAVADLAAQDTIAFAIPGKPVGAHTITSLVARSFFTGQTELPAQPATLTVDIGIGREGFDYVVPVTVTNGEAEPLGHIDSPLKIYDEIFDPSVLSQSTRATRADGFFITQEPRTAGETIDVVPYSVVE